MASANPVLNDHTTADSNDPGSDRNDFEQVRGVLPLEIQEHIISPGSWKTERDRVEFLCLCALVCKAWVARSRSALGLYVWGHCSQSFLKLVNHPNQTLTHSIKRLEVGTFEEYAVVGPLLLSVEELKICGVHANHVAEALQHIKHYMPSLRSLALDTGAYRSMDDFLTFLALFPSIHSLEISGLRPLDESKDDFFQTLGVPVWRVTQLTFAIRNEWDTRFLGPLLALLPGIQRLQLRAEFYPHAIGKWITQHPLNIRAEIEVSLELYCSKRDRRSYDINKETEDLFGMFDSFDLDYPHLAHLEQMFPLWISYGAARLKSITFTQLDAKFPDGLDGVDWTALSSSLGAAKQLKDVRFVKWWNYERIPEYIKALSVLAHPHFSFSVQMSEDPDSVEQLIV